MELIKANEIAGGTVLRSFGHKPLGAFVVLVVVMACPGLPIVLAMADELPRWVYDLPWWGWVLGSPILLITFLLWLLLVSSMWSATMACFRSSNWVMKVTLSGVYLKFRSYLNFHFPEEAPTVVFVPFGELEAARKTVERIAVPDARGRTVVRIKNYLDLHLRGVDTAPLDQAVAEETARKPPKRGISSSRFHDVPVRVPTPDVIRVEWRGGSMLKVLKPHIAIRPTLRIGHGYDQPSKDADDRITELVEQGDPMGATRLARRSYGMSLTEAQAFVSDLTNQLAHPADEPTGGKKP